MNPPQNIPGKGFYYHYKHDPNGPINAYAYQVLGVGHHTEEDLFFVVYRPIYEAYVYKLGKMFDIRPLDTFMEQVEKDGYKIARFERVTDPLVLLKLIEIRDSMYPEDLPLEPGSCFPV
ncbi:MAG: hypothetical protein JWN50_106 [Parcubacteria group bacterium]|nr:hypothetical protein [Parcubacteria group bacterium]